MSKLLPDFPGKEVVILAVTYPPGHSGAAHRHKADGFIYVLEGSIAMGINGDDPVTLGPGQTFYEGPNDIHTIGPQREQDETGQVPSVPDQGQRCSDLNAGEVAPASRSVTLCSE